MDVMSLRLLYTVEARKKSQLTRIGQAGFDYCIVGKSNSAL